MKESFVGGVAINRMRHMRSPEGLGGSGSHLWAVASLSQMVLVGTSQVRGWNDYGEQGRKEQGFGKKNGLRNPVCTRPRER